MPREPVLPVSAARRAKAIAARRERRAWMPSANARRRGMGDPEATLESESAPSRAYFGAGTGSDSIGTGGPGATSAPGGSCSGRIGAP